jgi:hypothetical protein
MAVEAMAVLCHHIVMAGCAETAVLQHGCCHVHSLAVRRQQSLAVRICQDELAVDAQ